MLPRWLLLCLVVLACSGAAASIPQSRSGLDCEHPLAGFYCLGVRNYDPQSGRFLSPDPLGHAASLSLYDYADGDPVNGIDPDGRLGKQVWTATKQDAGWALDTFNNAFYGTAAGTFKLAGAVDVAMQSQFRSFNPEYSQWNQAAMAMEANYNLAEKQGWYRNNELTSAVQNTASMVGPIFAGKLIPTPAAPIMRSAIATELTAAKTATTPGRTIGLGLDAELANLRGTGALSYKNGNWQQAGLTTVDWGRASVDNSWFRMSFREAAQNADAIRFDVSSYSLNYARPGMTAYELNHVVNTPSLLQKTTFIQNGQNVIWNGTQFVRP